MADESADKSAEARRSGITEARIAHIADLMRNCQWVTGRSGKELAKEWGITYDYLRHLSAEASRRVKKECLDPEAVGAQVGAALSAAVREAMQDRDWKALAQLSRVWIDASGAGAPQKIEATVTAGVVVMPPEDADGGGEDSGSGDLEAESGTAD